MKVLTWNLWGIPVPLFINRERRLEQVRATIKEELPDLAGLQEIIYYRDAVGFKEFKEFVHYKDYDDFLERMWKLHSIEGEGEIEWEEPQEVMRYSVFFEKLYNYQASIGARATLGAKDFTLGGLLSLCRNTVEIKSKPQTTVYLQQADLGNYKGQFFDKLVWKGFQSVDLNHSDLGDFTYINTHIVATGCLGDHTDPTLKAQLDQLLEHVETLDQQGKKIILTGDLNFYRFSLPNARYVRLKELIDETTKKKLLKEYTPPESKQKIFASRNNNLDLLRNLNILTNKFEETRSELGEEGFKVFPLYNPLLGDFFQINTRLLSPQIKKKRKRNYQDKRYHHLLDEINRLTKEDKQVVVVTDGNFNEFSSPYQRLLNYFEDCSAEACGLDYILASKGIKAIKFNDDLRHLSDHTGLYVDITL